MKKNYSFIFLMVCVLIFAPVNAAKRYSLNYCTISGYECIKVKKGQSWERLFPDPTQQLIVKKLNRMNTNIYAGMTIAVPKNLANLQIMDISPFPSTIEAPGEKLIVVDPAALAFAAYTADGKQIYWGPISGGQVFCGDVGKQCRTMVGKYRIYHKENEQCISKIFPVGKGGAPMPYCMYFHAGAALHGGPHELPGYHASHGCVRLFVEDAAWLNNDFIDIATKEGQKGTLVVINPYY